MIIYTAILLLAGKGERFGLPFNKILYKINNKPLYCHPLEVFIKDEKCEQIIIVYNESDEMLSKTLPHCSKIKTTPGGKTRTESVKLGLELTTSEYVLIHDGARCLLTQQMVDKCCLALENYNAVCLAHPIADTIKEYKEGQLTTLSRENLYAVETPQAFKTSLIKKAIKNVDCSYDDMSVVEKEKDAKPFLVINEECNIKATYQSDLVIIETILERRYKNGI